uniref:dolichyl-phosphate-mannose--protein mannosyltransferase n=2 Tax=Dermatophagoides pteronyssinus TaxID=6956 RepID=A0A6P6Y629_DERPT|nr:transmembrane and TPR repeat-containing protein 1-like isoform X2 [Dermatophagoides pteronyssinus]
MCQSLPTSTSSSSSSSQPIIEQLKSFWPSPLSSSSSSSLISSTIIIIYIVIILISIICFSNSLNGDFVHDDIPAIVKNDDVHGTTTIWQLFNNDFWGRPMSDTESHKSYRPITTFTFRLNMMISTQPFGFHLINLFLHIIVSLLVFIIGHRILLFDIHIATIAGLLFAIHPIHTEAIVSIVGRADLLCALFYLLAFLSFHLSLPPLRNHQSSSTSSSSSSTLSLLWLIPFVLSTTMALLSKEIGITIIGVCAFYWLCYMLIAFKYYHYQWLYFFDRQFWIPIITTILSFFILMIIRLRMLGDNWPLFSEQDNPTSYSRSMLTRILTYCYISAYNIRLLLNPTNQSYDWQTSTIRLINSLNDQRNLWTLTILIMSILLLYCSITKLLWSNHHSHHPIETSIQLAGNGKISANNNDDDGKTLFIAIIMLIIPYLPASNLFITVGFVIAERLLYVPSIGFIFIICYGIQQLRRQFHKYHRYINLMILILMAVFLIKTFKQNQVWSSRETLYKSGIINVPENAKAHYNYGNLQQDLGNWNDAIEHYQTAIRLWPDHASAHNNLGALYWKISSPDLAEQHFQQALIINPYHAKAYFNLAKVYSKRGQTNEAIRLMEHSICLDRKFAESYEALAELYSKIGYELIAERFYYRAIHLRRKNADFYNNFGTFLQRTGRLIGAEKNYLYAIRLKPEHQIAIINMANLLTLMKQFDRAEYFYKRAIKLRQDAITLDSLGTLYLHRSKLQLANRIYQKLFHTKSSFNEQSNQSIENHQTTTIQQQMTINHHHHQNQRHIPSINMANIHYAQLLIMEKKFDQAQVILETLINKMMKDTDDKAEKQNSEKQSIEKNGQLSTTTTTLILDVYHQLALLFTMTNRTEKALESIGKALNSCPNHFDSSTTTTATTATNNNIVINKILNHCAQIWTLKGDIQKDQFHTNRSKAIKSYQMAIKLDHCQSRAHLHLAVIYHLEQKFNQAMFHYLQAKQFDYYSINQQLIDDNIRKLDNHFDRKHYQQHQTINDEDKFNPQIQCRWQTTSSMFINIHSSNTINDNGNQSNDQHHNQQYLSNIMMAATEPPDIIYGSQTSSLSSSSF